MKILYAPSQRAFSDDLRVNVACGFDVMVLDSILESKSGEVLYLPHEETSPKIVEAILGIFGDSLEQADGMAKVDVLVSDVSILALKYALWTSHPSILCLFGFNGIQLPQNDRYYNLVSHLSHCVYSPNALKETLRDYQNIKEQKQEEIKKFLQGVVL
ncbi:hypothetical protein [Helicobacter sp.]|uniref:hypothetical protein n=1 Tax=Helicobacter sp. TaxID=218 RepID=UPI0025B8141D|nr:hypothetical protein [Helicobacter sp.]MCI5967961.1 hypothetical protein [Helicobacter sp.]MDY2585074.1 hypothetical protein [Helicobacter sp.]